MLPAQKESFRSANPALIRPIDVDVLERSLVLGAQLVLVAAGYYLAARLGQRFRFQDSLISVIWPANAVLVSALILVPRRRWWAVLVVAGFAHIAAMGHLVPAWRWTWQILGNSAFAVATAMVLQRFAGLPLRFESRKQVLAFTAISFVMPGLFAFTMPAFVRSLFGLEPPYEPPASLLRVMLTNATGMLLVAPVVLLWAHDGLRRLTALPARRLYEAFAVMIALLLVGSIAFGTGPDIARFPSLLLWIVPPLLWAAVRFGPLGAATSLLYVAGLSVTGTARQLGPFVLLTDGEQVLSLQLFWIVLCAPIMLLAAVIREREKAEVALNEQRNQLAHVTRVAAVGELSGALAHELRQPLMAILANAQAGTRILQRRPVDLLELREIFDDITQQNRQAASVISRVRAFLKEGDPRFETLELDAVLRDALALGRSTIAFAGADVELRITDDLPRVRGDRVQLLQVMLNLIINGCEAMINRPAFERRLVLHIAPVDTHVELVVTDCGTGLGAGTDLVFEPFFTTKDKGLGLGLAIGRSIATAHGGRLLAENNALGGATFRLLLPAESSGNGHPVVSRDS